MLVSLFTNAHSADLTINAQLSITDLHMLGFGKGYFPEFYEADQAACRYHWFFQSYSRAPTAKLGVLWLPYLFIFYLYIMAFTFLL